MNIPIIYEDKNVLAINKPAGLLVHGVKGKHAKAEPDLVRQGSVIGSASQGEAKLKEQSNLYSMVDWIKDNRPEIKNVGDHHPHVGQSDEDRPGIVHRLDRETSGVMLIAKNQEYFDYLKKLFQDHTIKKTYMALVAGRVEKKSGVIDKPIGIKDGTIKRTVHTAKAKMIREAITEYEVKKYFKTLDPIDERKDKEYTLVECRPKTGRTHQIRVHLASIGHPVVGDSLYGSKDNKIEGLNRHFLHADSIEFTNESGKRIKISADIPEELEIVLKRLSKSA